MSIAGSTRRCFCRLHVLSHPPGAISKHAFLSPQSEKLLEPLARIEMPVVRVLAEVEAKGIAANPAVLAAQKYGSDAAHMTANASLHEPYSQVQSLHFGVCPCWTGMQSGLQKGC